MQIRTLRKLSGTITDIRAMAQRAPYIFEDIFTRERFLYPARDTSIYARIVVGGDVLAAMNSSWVKYREKLEDNHG